MALGIVNTLRSPQTFGIHVDEVSDMNIICSGENVQIKWTDPEDVYSKGAVLARWGGTMLVRKEGSEPSNKGDGLILLKSTTKNQYSTTGYIDTPPQSNTVYYYKLFTYSTGNVYSKGVTLPGKMASTFVDIPYFSGDTEFTYDGEPHSVTVVTDSNYTVNVSGVQTATDGGTYKLTYTLNGDSHVWSDGSIAPKVLEWNINPLPCDLAISKNTVYMQGEPETLTYIYTGDGHISFTQTNPDLVQISIRENNTIYFYRKSATVGTSLVTLIAHATSNYEGGSVQFRIINYKYKRMTVQIDQSQSDPELSCTYFDDAVNMTPGSAKWDEFFGHYPVLFKDGQEVVKLNPNDFSKDIDGNDVDITSGDSGDVMIAFPRRGISISTTGNVITVTMTEHPEDSNFTYYAHSRGDTQKDIFYIASYQGYVLNNQLRSLSGKTPTANVSLDNYRIYSQSLGSPNGEGGSGYDVQGWFQFIYTQVMYILKYKNLNSQAILGGGNNNNSGVKTTGNTNDRGMDYGIIDNYGTQVKLFGLEDKWGNYWEWIEGLIMLSNKIYVSNDNFNNSATNYTDTNVTRTATINNYINVVEGSNLLGFLPKTTSGSSSTFYCDWGNVISGTAYPVSGNSNSSTNVYGGVFTFWFNQTSTAANSAFTSRLMYV